jgi:hypothetical protein
LTGLEIQRQGLVQRGFTVYLMNVPLCWTSKIQREVTLSISKEEYVAISESVKEIKSMYFLLCDIGIDVELPIVVKTDYIGAMLMANVALTGVYRRNVDTWDHFIRESGEEVTIKIELVILYVQVI